MLSFWVLLLVVCLSSSIEATPLQEDAEDGPKPRTFGLLCSFFCEDVAYKYDDYSYSDYYDFRAVEDRDRPRIFCRICRKKYGTSTLQPVTDWSGDES